jgi:hypothetical protein
VLRELVVAAERLRAAKLAIDHVLLAVERLDPFLPDEARLGTVAWSRGADGPPGDAEKYRITRRTTYADVVLREVPYEEFTAEEAWETIRPLIRQPPERGRESMRRSLENDARFERVRTPRGVRYRKLLGPVPGV